MHKWHGIIIDWFPRILLVSVIVASVHISNTMLFAICRVRCTVPCTGRDAAKEYINIYFFNFLVHYNLADEIAPHGVKQSNFASLSFEHHQLILLRILAEDAGFQSIYP